MYIAYMSAGIFSFTHRNKLVWLLAAVFLYLLYTGYADPFAIIMAYFIESIVIGLLNFLKMLMASNKVKTKQIKPAINGSAVFKSFFFLIHYSFFIFVQTTFIFAMFSMTDNNIKSPMGFIDNFSYAFTMDGFGISMGIMAVLLILDTYFEFIKPKIYLKVTADDLLFKPYIRVFVQQFTVLIAMFFVMIFQSELAAATVLIVIRLFIDLIGIYISSDDKNIARAARFIKRDHKRSDLEAIEELKRYL